MIGTGVITLDGQTETLVVDLNAPLRLGQRKLAANDVSIEIDGVGTADAAQTLDVVIAGSGVVTYSRSTITQNITGTGAPRKERVATRRTGAAVERGAAVGRRRDQAGRVPGRLHFGAKRVLPRER